MEGQTASWQNPQNVKSKKNVSIFLSELQIGTSKRVLKKNIYTFSHAAYPSLEIFFPWPFFWKSMNTVVDIEPKNKISFRQQLSFDRSYPIFFRKEKLKRHANVANSTKFETKIVELAIGSDQLQRGQFLSNVIQVLGLSALMRALGG